MSNPSVKKTIAIITAKGNSRRVVNKCLLSFNGKPLLHYTIVIALKSQHIDEVFVSTESEEIKELAEAFGAKVPFLRRPEYSGHEVHSNIPLIDMLEKLGGAAQYDFCVKLLPTSPLRKLRSLNNIVELSKLHQRNILSVTDTGFTLPHLRTLSAGDILTTLGGDKVYNFQNQDAPNVFGLVGVAQCAPVAELLNKKTFQYGNPMGYVVDKYEAAEIDTMEDFSWAEMLAKNLGEWF